MMHIWNAASGGAGFWFLCLAESIMEKEMQYGRCKADMFSDGNRKETQGDTRYGRNTYVVTVQGYREGSDTTEILVREIRSREKI
jgi:hypothetical protein